MERFIRVDVFLLFNMGELKKKIGLEIKKGEPSRLVPFELDTQIAEILYYKALQLYRAEILSDSLLIINKVISLSPKNFGYYHLKAKILYKLKKYHLSIKSINKAIKLRPKFLKLYRFKNKILFFMDRFDELLESLNELAKLDSEFEVRHYVLKASVLGLVLGRFNEALTEIKRALDIDSGFSKALEVKKKIMTLQLESQINHLYI